jgi:hypothetical protein
LRAEGEAIQPSRRESALCRSAGRWIASTLVRLAMTALQQCRATNKNVDQRSST